MAIYFPAALVVLSLVAVMGQDSQSKGRWNGRVPWVGYIFNEETQRCEVKTLYGGVTPPKEYTNLCDDCQRKASEGQDNNKCLGKTPPLGQERDNSDCDKSKYHWVPLTGQCKTGDFGCSSQPGAASFDDEESCEEACQGLPPCSEPTKQ